MELKPAPNFTLKTAEGIQISLNESIESDENILLVFLRHLG